MLFLYFRLTLEKHREKQKGLHLAFIDLETAFDRVPRQEVLRYEGFKYLGSTMSADGELDEEIGKRIQAGWRNWRRLSGVLCDKRVSARKKGKVYKVAVRPALTYGAETWGIKKTQEDKLDVAEMKMLRWASGHTIMDRVENETRRTLEMKVEGKRRQGRPRRRWMDCVKKDMMEKRLGEQDAADRQRWRSMTANSDPT